MRNTTRHIAVSTLALALGLSLALATPAAAGWWDEAGGAKETTLAELRRDPEPWRDVTIVLPARFERVPERVNPFFTQFNPGNWQPLAVRAVGERDGGEIVFDRVFVRRGSELERRLGKLTSGEALLLRGVVRDTVGAEPWIEVLGITRSGDGLTPEEEARVTQADRFLAKSNPVAAEKLYRSVLEARQLGDVERASLHRKLGAALYAQGRLEDSQTELRTALEIDPKDRAAADRLQRVTDALAAPKAAPPTARIARPAPRPPARLDEALTLPGDRPRLAPPSGIGGSIPVTSRTPPALAPTNVPKTTPATMPATRPVSLTELEVPATPKLTPAPVGPVSESPATETPATETPATETPATETPAPPTAEPDDTAERLPAPPRRRAAPPTTDRKPAPPSADRKPAPVRRVAPPRPRGEKPGRPLPAPKPAPVEEEEPVPPIPPRPPLVGPK